MVKCEILYGVGCTETIDLDRVIKYNFRYDGAEMYPRSLGCTVKDIIDYLQKNTPIVIVKSVKYGQMMNDEDNIERIINTSTVRSVRPLKDKKKKNEGGTDGVEDEAPFDE